MPMFNIGRYMESADVGAVLRIRILIKVVSRILASSRRPAASLRDPVQAEAMLGTRWPIVGPGTETVEANGAVTT